MRTTLLTIAFFVIGFAAFSQIKNNKKMETIVLVHGAWSDASAWSAVAPILKAKGFEVIEVNLPGHGKDNTSFATITLQSYVDAVKQAIGPRNNVVLVGHSMGGVVISQVAEEIPGQIKELVYLAAFLPRNGESLLSLSQQDADSHIGKYLQIDQAHGSANLAQDGIIDVFAADAPPAVADQLVAHFKADPLAPFATPVALTDANFGSVKKVYIHTLNDHAVSYTLQQAMVKKGHVEREYAIPTSHAPFISMPGVLAAIILQEASGK